MRYETLPTEFFKENREAFKKHLKPNSIAIFNSNDEMPKTADQVFPFRQSSDLFYLSGVDQEESTLILFPDAPYDQLQEILFLRKTNEQIAIWEGEKLTKERAEAISGIETIYWNENFEAVLTTLMHQAEHVYVNLNEHERYDSVVPYKDYRFTQHLKSQFPAHDIQRSAPIMRKLRATKKQAEIDQIQKASNITQSAFERVLKFVKPGVKEYEIEAEITHEFIRQGAEGHAYDPIVASGANACVLHYIKNDEVCKDGESILFDFGASYGNYASDMSRVIPVNGRFSKRQKAIYNAVLDVFRQAKQMLKPGTLLKDYQESVVTLIEEKLVDLNIRSNQEIKNQDPENPLYKMHFPHGTSHHMGLDVHDVPDRHKAIEEGMVFTCEPGIYVRDEGIGVRLENDVVVTKGEPIDLMKDIPIEAEEIEELMNKK